MGAEPFEFWVEDVFAIEGRGTVVVGHLTKGDVRAGQGAVLQSAAGAVEVPRVWPEIICRRVPFEGPGKPPMALLLERIDAGQVAAGERIVGNDSAPGG